MTLRYVYMYDVVVVMERQLQLLFAGLILVLWPFGLLYSSSVARIAVTITYLIAQSEH